MFVFSLSLHHKAVFEELKFCEALVKERRNRGHREEGQMKFPKMQPQIYFKSSVDVSHACHFYELRLRGQGSGIFFFRRSPPFFLG